MSDKGKERNEGNATGVAEGTYVVGVRFKPAGKVYLFTAGEIYPDPGTWVVVESDMGLSVGYVVKARHCVETPVQNLKRVLREATEKDREDNDMNRLFADEAKAFCMERVNTRALPMKIIATETTLDKKKLIFYFTADGRIDFRELVRDLAAQFKTRIEMRQIGVRDEVKFIGGIGSCGRDTCCRVFLTSFEPVSIRMAKKQELSINQSKLSGVCGRLMCCLGYEYEETERKSVHQDKAPLKDSADKGITSSKTQRTSIPSEIKSQTSCSCPQPHCQGRHEVMADVKEVVGADTLNAESKSEKRPSTTPQDKRKKSGKPFSRRRKFRKKK